MDTVKDTAVSEQAKILIITLLLLMLLIMMLVFHVHRQPDSADPSVRFCTRTWTPRQAIDAEKGLLWATKGSIGRQLGGGLPGLAAFGSQSIRD